MKTNGPIENSFRLQMLAFPEGNNNIPLYFFADQTEGKHSEYFSNDGSLKLYKNTRISFSTLLNSFYEAAWNRLSDLREVNLDIDILGHVRIEVFRALQNNSHEKIADVEGQNQQIRINIPLRTRTDEGRLFFTATGLDDRAELLDASWSTTQPPSIVALRIVICAFNKENFLIPNLRKLLNHFANCPELKEIIVINQGEQTKNLQDFAKGQEFLKLRVISQNNYGGSGGFTRGIIEALNKVDTSHVLLMDDDIIFEPFIIERLISVLKLSSGTKIIGGQMLELEHPMKMYASHERFSFEAQQPINPLCGLNLEKREAVEVFNRFHPSEYNGWWFCCLPRSAFEPDDLPLPLFVRGDDIEFSYRLRDKLEVITMPGIFVWHESFHFKSSSLMEYFTARNWLITTILHSNKPLRKVLSSFHESFWWLLCTYRYDLAHARLIALRDFQKGPEYIFASPLAKHTELASRLNQFQSTYVSLVEKKVSTLERRLIHSTFLRPLWDIWKAIWVFFLAPKIQHLNLHYEAVVSANEVEEIYFHNKKNIGILNEITKNVTVLAPSRSITRSLYYNFLKEIFRIIRGRKIIERYKDEYPKYTRSSYWRSYLNI